jgi:glycosyltransferase involved in cell wall biosynthesis
MNIIKNKVGRILIVTNHYYPENFKINDISNSFSPDIQKVVVTSRPNYPSGKFYAGFSKIKTKESETSIVYRLPVISRGDGSKFRIVLNYISYFIFLNIFFLKISLKREKFSHILVHHTSPPLLSIPPIFYKQIYPCVKLIYWELDVWPESLSAVGMIKKGGPIFRFIKRVMSFVYNKYDLVLIGSKSYRELLRDRLDVDKIIYFPNWAENCFENLHPSQCLDDIRLPEGFNVIYSGNIGTAQGLSIVLELIRDSNGINFHFIGDGKFRKYLEESVKKQKLEDRIFFLGYRSITELPRIMLQCDLAFLSLKDSEIFKHTVPAKLQAYMSIGIPVLGLISGEANRLINSSGCGIAVDYVKVEDAKIALSHFKNLTQHELKAYGENGKRYYDRNFAFKLRLKQLEDIFIKLA